MKATVRSTRQSVLFSAAALAAYALFATPPARGELPGSLISDFESASNKRTALGVTDGNPLAGTAVFANSMYRQLGFDFIRPEHFEASINGSYGTFDSGKVNNGHFASSDIALGFSFGDRIGLVLDLPIGFRDIGDTKTYIGGAGVGLPIVILDAKYRWIVSPWALGGIIDGSDLAQGGAQYGVGVTSLLGVALADTHLRLGMANQFSYIGGTPFGYSDHFDFKQNVDQFILKNGFELSGNITKSWQAYGSITYTNLMKDAFIDAYFTPELGLRWHSDHIAAGIAAFGDFGNRYTGFGGRATLAFLW